MTEIPTWEGFMIPLLTVMNDGVVRGRRELNVSTADVVGLTEEQRKVTMSSGQFLYPNRIGWGLSYLTNVGALERPRRGQYQITDAGR